MSIIFQVIQEKVTGRHKRILLYQLSAKRRLDGDVVSYITH